MDAHREKPGKYMPTLGNDCFFCPVYQKLEVLLKDLSMLMVR